VEKKETPNLNIAKEEQDVKGYTSISNWIIRNGELTPAEKCAFFVIASLYNHDLGFAWPSNKTIQKMAGISLPTVCRATRGLEKKGLITKNFRSGKVPQYIFPIWPFPGDRKKDKKPHNLKGWYNGDPVYLKWGELRIFEEGKGWLKFAYTKEELSETREGSIRK